MLAGCLLSLHATPPDTSWVQAKAQKGDFQDRLLRRYNLNTYTCNLVKFQKLNKLKANDKLTINKTYKLPIQIIKYNGKSIRTSLNINDLDQAIRIQQFNDHAQKAQLRVDDFRKSQDLWVAWHEYACPPDGEAAIAEDDDQDAEIIRGPKPAIGNRNFPIFGKNYAQTALLDQKLAGKVFYIVSGHGGIDSGAQGKRGSHTLCEDEYAYDVALRLTRLLVGHGATTYMIVRDPNDGIRDTEYLDCDTDEVLWGDKAIAAGQKERLQDRCEIINKYTAEYLSKNITDQTLIEIHVDSRSQSAKTDVFFYHRPESIASARIANQLQETFLLKYAKVRATRRYSGTVTARGLYMLTETKVPKAVYIELGNIRNPYDQLRLVLPKNRQLLAQWMLEAIKQ
jgi:N-acetylmuramoyl-L-alanine amidase